MQHFFFNSLSGRPTFSPSITGVGRFGGEDVDAGCWELVSCVRLSTIGNGVWDFGGCRSVLRKKATRCGRRRIDRPTGWPAFDYVADGRPIKRLTSRVHHGFAAAILTSVAIVSEASFGIQLFLLGFYVDLIGPDWSF